MILAVAGFKLHLWYVLGCLLAAFTGRCFFNHDVLHVVQDRVKGLKGFDFQLWVNFRCAGMVVILTLTVVTKEEVQKGQLSAKPTLKDIDV